MRLHAVAGVLLALIAATGCCSGPRGAQSGSVFVTALSTTDWQRYKDQFQPHFELSESDALKRAVPDTLQVERSVLDTLAVGLRVKTLSGDLAGHDDPAALKPDAAATGTPAKATEAATVIDAGKLQVDPRLQYLLATALWQEVQMLNRFVEDAAVSGLVGTRGTGVRYAPFITRLQIANMPRSEEASYTADLRIKFSSDDPKQPPRVVPLLINDHVEAALASRRDEELRRFTLSLMAIVEGIGLGADVDKLHSEINRSLVREFHSLLTVGQPNAHELVVRVGARRVGDREYRATSEPHYLTVLLLVPIPEKTVETQALTGPEPDRSAPVSKMNVGVSYETSLFDARSGSPIDAGAGDLRGTFELTVERPKQAWLRSVQTALAFDDGAKTTVTLNDAEGFYPDDVVATWFFTTEGDPNLHAVSSGGVRVIGRAKQLVFDFPSLKRMGLKPKPGVIPDHFKKKRNVREVAPAAIAERTAADPTPERSFMVKILRGPPDAHDDADYLFYPWKYAVADAKPDLRTGMKMTTSRSLLPHANHSAALDVHIVLPDTEADGVRSPAAGFKLMVQGADAAIASTTPAGIAAPPADGARTHLELLKSGTVTLTLNGLYKDGKVVLKIAPPSGWAAPDDIELKVID